MGKILVVMFLVLALLIAGCTNVPDKSGAGVPSPSPSPSPQPSPSPAPAPAPAPVPPADKCAALKTASGEFIYTEKDADSQFPFQRDDESGAGKWENNGLTLNLPVCSYFLNTGIKGLGAPVRDIRIFLLSDYDFNSAVDNKKGYGWYKEVPNLGDRAFFIAGSENDFISAHLYIKKKGVHVSIECRDCKENQFIQIGQTLTNRLP